MSMSENQRFIIRLIIIIVLAAGFILILPRLQSIITVIVISILMFTLLDPFVDKLERFKIPRALSALLVIIIILLLIAFGVSRIVPLVENAAQQLSQSFSSENTFSDRLESGIEYLNNRLPLNAITTDLPEKINEVTDNLRRMLPGVLMGFGKGLINALSSFFFVLFITFFFLKDERAIKKGIIRLVPNKHFEMSLNIMDKIQKQLSSYLQGLFLAATSVGITSIIGLFIVNTFFDAGINYI
ncbi:MAG TPA: AI-2E family transporter, partial [Candidatus Marinimicrobia bacterium]|nr:AI-2E family transporter [Candidatus Neomarinimicrobiota bacterium]